MCYMGLAGGSAPSTPGRTYGASPAPVRPAVDATRRRVGSPRDIGRLGERCHRPAVVTRRGGSECHDGVRRVKRCRVPPLRSGRSGDSPATVADGGWLLTDAGVRLVNETGTDGTTVPRAHRCVRTRRCGGAEALPGRDASAGSDPAREVWRRNGVPGTLKRCSPTEAKGFRSAATVGRRVTFVPQSDVAGSGCGIVALTRSRR